MEFSFTHSQTAEIAQLQSALPKLPAQQKWTDLGKYDSQNLTIAKDDVLKPASFHHNVGKIATVESTVSKRSAGKHVITEITSLERATGKFPVSQIVSRPDNILENLIFVYLFSQYHIK
jgi:hypothetical protein